MRKKTEYSVDITHYLVNEDQRTLGSKYWKFDTYEEAFKYFEDEIEKYQKDEAVTDIKSSTKHMVKVYRQRENKWILTMICLNYV